jgi:hypothetical protein
MAIAIGLLIGAFVVFPIVGYFTGMFNPIGYLGVPPWRVPRCESCGRKKGVGHDLMYHQR